MLQRAIAMLLLAFVCGCSIPIYSVRTEYHGSKSVIERELDRILADGTQLDDAITILVDNGYTTQVHHDDAGTSLPHSIRAEKRNAYDTQDAKISIPVESGRIVRPFRIEWVEVATGTTDSTSDR
ncbi:hypothetical protein K239x_24750 [Planctomycetes bacterium K23_9]|uniref:Uncharacterized protein n=2 Tax=Stieleria marina TaxID=1930275 RepID=A0A517NTS1_9BACT|nr:hypothetical protein K239x_24750 [Planctomycetes bacterium K23_9]